VTVVGVFPTALDVMAVTTVATDQMNSPVVRPCYLGDICKQHVFFTLN